MKSVHSHCAGEHTNCESREGAKGDASRSRNSPWSTWRLHAGSIFHKSPAMVCQTQVCYIFWLQVSWLAWGSLQISLFLWFIWKFIGCVSRACSQVVPHHSILFLVCVLSHSVEDVMSIHVSSTVNRFGTTFLCLNHFLTWYCRGAGLPTNTPSVPCIFDPVARVGICGDWLLGSSLEGAALSGMALAEHVISFFTLWMN